MTVKSYHKKKAPSKNNDKVSSKHLGLLFLLYFSQGLPFGFQATALPVYLRSQGVSLTAIGFTGLLALPWMFKPLFAPFSDRYYNKRFGKRKSWIVPMQTCLLLSSLVASITLKNSHISILFASVFAMNFFSAIQDIAVDGLAVDLLSEKELGPGNAAQVIGYKAGMIISGGLLVFLTSMTGWQGMFAIMSFLIFCPLVAILLFREPMPGLSDSPDQRDLKKIMQKIMAMFKGPSGRWLIFFIATYKTGELMIDVMFKPFLVDSGFTASQIGLWVGTYGMVASLSGSFIGGAISKRYSLMSMLALSLVLRTVPLGFEWALTLYHPTDVHVIGVTVFEHFFGGMLTTVMFAFMMSQVDKSIGATHYTILAAIEVIGKSPGAWASGPLSDAFGYSPIFLSGICLSLLPIFLIFRYRQTKTLEPA
ncbi:MAG: MFS transporter [Proteobacteria bacterium]|nr:MFS transporter [Pseudomonadota bacterium]